MASQHRLPENSLLFIQQCVRRHRLFWSYHVNMRMRARGIKRDQIIQAVDSFEIIEDYPDDKYLPSCLVFALSSENRVMHCVIALDVAEENVRVVTAYYPSYEYWSKDMKKRVKQ